MLSKCTQKLYAVCPAHMMLKTAGESNCLTAFFLGKTDIALTKCKRLIINTFFEPNWIRSPDFSYWIYSLSTPQRVTIQCQEMGSPPTSKPNYQMVLKGTGVLLNFSTCYVHAGNFKLLPHSLGKTIIHLAKAHIVLPNIERILNFSEESLLQSDMVQPIDLQRIDRILERDTLTL